MTIELLERPRETLRPEPIPEPDPRAKIVATLICKGITETGMLINPLEEGVDPEALLEFAKGADRARAREMNQPLQLNRFFLNKLDLNEVLAELQNL